MLTRVKGNVLENLKAPCFLLNACSHCIPGRWGSPFLIELGNKFEIVETRYRRWSSSDCNKEHENYVMGAVQYVMVSDGVYVANMIVEAGWYKIGRRSGIRQDSLRIALQDVRKQIQNLEDMSGLRYVVLSDRLGKGNIKNDLVELEKIVEEELGPDIEVYMYDKGIVNSNLEEK